MFNGSIGELFRLPEFLTHFSEHQTQDNTISIGDFITMHYLGDDQNDADQDKDMELPFKKIDFHFSFQIAAFPDSRLIPEKQFEPIDSYLQIGFKNHAFKNPTLVVLQRPPCFA